jgi:hypothetical protein
MFTHIFAFFGLVLITAILAQDQSIPADTIRFSTFTSPNFAGLSEEHFVQPDQCMDLPFVAFQADHKGDGLVSSILVNSANHYCGLYEDEGCGGEEFSVDGALADMGEWKVKGKGVKCFRQGDVGAAFGL